MGKHFLSSSSVQFQDNNPSCMWGILQLLDYYHWHIIRNLFPHKKHHARYKRKHFLKNHGEDHHQFGVEEAEPLLARQHSQRLNATFKSSKKGSHTENSCKEDYSKDWKPEKHLDVLEVFRVEKDFFLNFFQDVDGKNFHQASNDKARFTKSGTFPQTSQMRNTGPSTLEHKQNEIGAFHKSEKLLSVTQVQRRFASSFAQDISFVKPMPLESDHSVNNAMKEELSFYSSCYSLGLNHKGWNQIVLHRFKMMKQKLKQAIKVFRKSGLQTSVEAIHHIASSEVGVANNSKEDSTSLDKIKACGYDSNKHEIQLKGRSSSPNESLDRYAQLFEKSFNNDMIKWHGSMSKSLKLPNEDKDNMRWSPPLFFSRNLSLPNPEPLGFLLLHEELSNSNDTEISVETDIHVQRKSVSFPELDHLTETKMSETVDKDGKVVNPIPVSDADNENIQMWQNVMDLVNQHQQLNPFLLMVLDASLCHKVESFGEETNNPYHYQLLFDVVKEVVLEGSPIQFSSSYFNRCHYSMHRENYLLNEVWTRVSSYLSLRPEQDHSLDAIVGRDVAKSSGWMNLQQEEEHVVLELEGMIVEELLEEVIFM